MTLEKRSYQSGANIGNHLHGPRAAPAVSYMYLFHEGGPESGYPFATATAGHTFCIISRHLSLAPRPALRAIRTNVSAPSLRKHLPASLPQLDQMVYVAHIMLRLPHVRELGTPCALRTTPDNLYAADSRAVDLEPYLDGCLGQRVAEQYRRVGSAAAECKEDAGEGRRCDRGGGGGVGGGGGRAAHEGGWRYSGDLQDVSRLGVVGAVHAKHTRPRPGGIKPSYLLCGKREQGVPPVRLSARSGGGSGCRSRGGRGGRVASARRSWRRRWRLVGIGEQEGLWWESKSSGTYRGTSSSMGAATVWIEVSPPAMDTVRH